MGNVAPTIECNFRIFASIVNGMHECAKLSRGSGSGGDISVLAISSLFLRSILMGREDAVRIGLMDWVECVEVEVVELMNGFVVIGERLKSKVVEGCRIEVNVLSSIIVCLLPRATLGLASKWKSDIPLLKSVEKISELKRKFGDGDRYIVDMVKKAVYM